MSWSNPWQSRWESAAGFIPFSPADIAGLQLWLKADSLSLANNDPVASWTDASGNSNHATQGTSGAQPTFKTNILNGLPVVRFDGVNDMLNLTTHLTSHAMTIIAVANKTGTGTQAIIVTDSNEIYAEVSTNWGSYLGDFLDGGSTLSSSFSVLSVVTRNYNDVDLVKNGSLVTRVNGNTWYTRSGTAIGADPSGVQFLGGDIAELLVYGSALSSTDRGNVEAYLQGKYGL